MFDGFMFYGDKPDGFLLHLSKLVKDNMDMDIEWCYKDQPPFPGRSPALLFAPQSKLTRVQSGGSVPSQETKL
jgi:hypothetical protein